MARRWPFSMWVGLVLAFAGQGVLLADQRIAVLPLSPLGVDRKRLAAVEREFLDATKVLQSTQLILPETVSAELKRRGRVDLSLCGEDAACLLDIVNLIKCDAVLVGHVGEIGGGEIVYAKRIDPKDGREVASTTTSLGKEGESRRVALQSLLVRVLEPARYVGELRVNVDVPSAEVFVDGRKIAQASSAKVSVGTHAVRVTHPTHRDWMRFVDVGFGDKPTQVDVALGKWPKIVATSNAPKQSGHRAGEGRKTAWYGRPWVLLLGGAIVFGTTAAIVANTRGGVDSDSSLTLTP